jgi:hypothetical protein
MGQSILPITFNVYTINHGKNTVTLAASGGARTSLWVIVIVGVLLRGVVGSEALLLTVIHVMVRVVLLLRKHVVSAGGHVAAEQLIEIVVDGVKVGKLGDAVLH